MGRKIICKHLLTWWMRIFEDLHVILVEQITIVFYTVWLLWNYCTKLLFYANSKISSFSIHNLLQSHLLLKLQQIHLFRTETIWFQLQKIPKYMSSSYCTKSQRYQKRNNEVFKSFPPNTMWNCITTIWESCLMCVGMLTLFIKQFLHCIVMPFLCCVLYSLICQVMFSEQAIDISSTELIYEKKQHSKVHVVRCISSFVSFCCWKIR
jgi:hypothetical protein